MARELKRRGHEVKVLGLIGSPEFTTLCREQGVDATTFSFASSGIGTAKLHNAMKVLRVLAAERPDIVHTHDFQSSFHGRIASALLGIPCVAHIHSKYMPTRRSHLFYNRLLARWTKSIVCVSESLRTMAAETYGQGGVPVQVNYCGVSPEKLDGASIDFGKEFGFFGRPIIMVTRLVKEKNILFLLEAFAKLQNALPDVGLFFIGDGPDKELLATMRDRLGLDNRVFMTGFRSEVGPILRWAAERGGVFAFPSPKEGFGIAPLEAMLCGVPTVIAPDVPVLELAEEMLPVPLEVDLWTKRLTFLLENAEERERSVQQGFALSRKVSFERTIEDMERVYQDVLLR